MWLNLEYYKSTYTHVPTVTEERHTYMLVTNKINDLRCGTHYTGKTPLQIRLKFLLLKSCTWLGRNCTPEL